MADGTVKEYLYPRRRVDKTQSFEPDSLTAMIQAYRRSQEWDGLRPHTKVVYQIYHRPLERIGHIKVSDLTRRMVLDIRDAIHTARGPGAAVGFLRATKAAMSWAADRGWIDASPAYGIKATTRGTLPAWTEEVFEKALKELAEPYRRVVVLAAHTGQRRGDLIAFRWRDYDGATIRLVQQKSKMPLAIPVHGALRKELDRWKKGRTETDTILTAPRGQPWTAAHLSREMGKEVGKLGLGRFTPHGLRKLAATRLAEAGCTPHQIAALCGWRSLSMVQHYTRSLEQEATAREAMSRLEAVSRPSVKPVKPREKTKQNQGDA